MSLAGTGDLFNKLEIEFNCERQLRIASTGPLTEWMLIVISGFLSWVIGQRPLVRAYNFFPRAPTPVSLDSKRLCFGSCD